MNKPAHIRSIGVSERFDGQPQAEHDSWWDIRKSARHCDVSVAFLRKAVRLKMVPFSRVGTKLLRFRRTELDKWLESNGTGGEITYRKS